MTKLLYIHNTDAFASTANLTQVVSMCNAFCSKGLEVALLLPVDRNRDQKELDGRLRGDFNLDQRLGITTFANPFKAYRLNKNANFISLWRHLRRIPNQEKPDLVFVRNVQYALVALLCGFRVIYESHNTLVHHGSAALNQLLTTLLIRASRHRRLLRFVSISENLNKFWMGKGVPRDKALAWHDGFEARAYEKVIPMDEARAMLGLPPQTPLVVYTGNIHENRGIRYIIELARHVPGFQFLVVGGPGSLITEYEKKFRVSTISNLQFLGPVPHARIPLYQFAADVLLAMWSRDVPTINYCSPLKLFEYMATGRPTLAAGYPTVREVLRDELAPLCFEPDNPDALKQKLLDFEKDPLPFLEAARRAREQAFRVYSWENRVDQILNRLPQYV